MAIDEPYLQILIFQEILIKFILFENGRYIPCWPRKNDVSAYAELLDCMY